MTALEPSAVTSSKGTDDLDEPRRKILWWLRMTYICYAIFLGLVLSFDKIAVPLRQNFLNMSNLRSRYAHCSTAVKFFQWLGIMIVSGLAVMFLVVLLFPTPLGLQSLKLFQAIQSLAIFVMPPFVVAYLWSARPLEWLGLSSFPSWRITVSALLWLLVAIPGINILELSYLFA